MSERNPSLGKTVCEWIETNLCHGPGDAAGEPIELTRDQRRFIWTAYELRSNGRKQYRRCFYSRPKGSAKSELAAFLCIAEAIGPVRWSGEYDEDGFPTGVPVSSPEILCVATEENQADNTYGSVRYILQNGPIADTPGLVVGVEKTLIPGGGVIEPSGSSARSADGAKTTFAVLDETHEWTTANLKKLHTVITQNILKRAQGAQAWCLETSTMYARGQESVAESTHTYYQGIREGKYKDSSLLFDHRQANAKWNLDDEQQRLAALQESYGDVYWMDLEAISLRWHEPQYSHEDFRRYFLNQPVVNVDAWLDVELWRALAEPQQVAHGEAITLGFDGSRSEDSTALIGCRISDGLIFPIHVWEKPLGQLGVDWEVSSEDVSDALALTFERYNVKLMFADPPLWQSDIEQWQKLYGDVVRPFHTNHDTKMSAALDRFGTDVRSKTLKHDGNETLTSHIGNARKRDRPRGLIGIYKENKKSPNKIDAAVAATLAYAARAQVSTEEKPKAQGRPWTINRPRVAANAGSYGRF